MSADDDVLKQSELQRRLRKAGKQPGGIVPGAHPEFENRPVGPANPITEIKKMVEGVRKMYRGALRTNKKKRDY